MKMATPGAIWAGISGFGIGLGWSVLLGGDFWKYATGFGLAHPRSRNFIWRGALRVAPLAWGGMKVIGSDIAIVSRAAMGTRTASLLGGGISLAAAAGLGYTGGAVVGTGIISVAEKKGIVYQGATADVLDFYMGEGHYWDQGERPTPGYFNIPGNLRFIYRHYRYESGLFSHS